MEIYRDAPNRGPDDLDIVLRVIERRRESLDCESLFFERPRGREFEPGDWVDIRFLAPELAVGRTFSFSSAPTEPDLRITFKRGLSPFKRRLHQVEPGESLLITQYGSNGFRLNRRSPAVFVAGGIGIAPFRSMIKNVIDDGAGPRITLVQTSRTDDAPFRQELLGWSGNLPGLDVHHVVTARDGRLTVGALTQLLSDRTIADASFYAAGPPAMVAATEKLLARLGVRPKAIMTDRFTGY